MFPVYLLNRRVFSEERGDRCGMSNNLRDIVPDSSGLIKKKNLCRLVFVLSEEILNGLVSEAERSCREGV